MIRHKERSENEMKELLYGNRSMIACVICYLVWWVVTFKPPAPKGSFAGSIFLIGAFLFGLGGIFLIVHAISRLSEQPAVNPFIPLWMIPAAGALFYVVSLMITSKVLHRQVTSELLIIIVWTVLELCFVSTMYRYDIIGKGALAALLAGIVVVMILSIICYLLYYNLEYVKGYYDGMIPLVLVGIMVALIDFVGWRSL